jgi:glycosyltransferase involved in cell wall biosynthesis
MVNLVARVPTHTRLAVFTSALGAPFIDPHIKRLLPGRTVVAGTRGSVAALTGMFPIECPVFDVDAWGLGLPIRIAARAGLPRARLRDAAVARFIRKHNVSVVLGEFMDFFIDFVPLIERLRLPYVVQGHGIDVSAALRIPGMAERYLAYQSAKAILTRSEFHRQRLIGLGLPAAKIHVNPGGVDVPEEPPRRTADAGRRFLAISIMRTKKAPIYLLEAFRLAAVRDPRITLDFIGGGPLLPAARQFVDACGLQRCVRLHGVTPEETKRRLLAESGVFVQHSLTDAETGDEEGLPAAIQEAMANGLAVVSTRHAGIPEAVIHGETGLLVEEGDVRGMADAMLAAIPNAGQMGLAGYSEARARYTWQHEKARLSKWLFDVEPGKLPFIGDVRPAAGSLVP